jgi:phospholipid/cholesterol/gamma-HCH transport system substrate-binding protein
MSLRIRAGLFLGSGLVLLLSGCGLGADLYHMPLPGGADVGSNPLKVTADFADAVDLVPQSSVKVENIAVGRVSSIKLSPDGRSARVTLLVRRDLDLPEGTTARLQQTSLLGEKYVALIRPATPGPTLKPGANIPIGDTSQVAEVEQVLGALSLVVNGGGIGKFQEISRELSKVSDGRPGEIRGFLDNMNVLVGGLNARKGAITDALDAVAQLSTTLNTDKSKIATALDGLSPGMQVLVDQRHQLVEMLTSLNKLSDVSVRTLNASQKDMTEDMQLLEPILRELAASGDALPNSLELLLTYPFPDSVLAAIKGDYLNVFVTGNYNSLPDSCAGFGCPWPQLPDTGTRAPIDPFGGSSGSSMAAAVGTAAQRASALQNAGKKPSTAGESASPSGNPSPSQSPSGSATPQPSPSPSPSLLPPTDSALPGIGQPSVQVPSPTSTSPTPSAQRKAH